MAAIDLATIYAEVSAIGGATGAGCITGA